MSKKRFLNSIVNKILLIEPTNKLSFLGTDGKKWSSKAMNGSHMGTIFRQPLHPSGVYTAPKYCFEGYIRLKAKKLEDTIICINDITKIDPESAREIISKLITMFMVFYSGNEGFNGSKKSFGAGKSITDYLKLEELDGKSFVCSSDDFEAYMSNVFGKELGAYTTSSTSAAAVVAKLEKEEKKKAKKKDAALKDLKLANDKHNKLSAIVAKQAILPTYADDAVEYYKPSNVAKRKADKKAADAAWKKAVEAAQIASPAVDDHEITKKALETAKKVLKATKSAETATEEKIGNAWQTHGKTIMNALFDSISIGVRLSMDVESNNKISDLAKKKGFIEKTIFYTSNDATNNHAEQGHFTVPLAQKEQRLDPADWATAVSKVNKFDWVDLVDILNLDSTAKDIDDIEWLLIALLKTKEFDALVKSVLVPAMLFNAMSVIPNIEIARDIIPIMRQSGVFKGMDEVLNEMFSSLSGYLLGDFPWARDCSDLAGLL